MFINNKYTAWYYKIIEDAKTNPREGYVEKHHIIPSSLGGSNDSENIVALSSREHFVCHYLLTKMLNPNTPEWHKMVRAVIFMVADPGKSKRYHNSRIYETAKMQFSKIQSEQQSGKGNSQYGTMWMVHEDFGPVKIQKSEMETYTSKGYVAGRVLKSASEIRSQERASKREQLSAENLDRRLEEVSPFYERHINGESIRRLAEEYGKSHVQLSKDIKLYRKWLPV